MRRVALVTGASRGLGAALVAALLGRGWEVIGVARHAPAGQRDRGTSRCRFIACDLADVAAIDAGLAPVVADMAALRPAAAVLINNAAIAGPYGVVGDLVAGSIATSLALNLAAPAALANLFCRAFAATRGERRIINVSSGAAVSPIAGAGAYCVAKAGLEMLTRMIAAEQGDHGIRCVTLRPGVVDTDMQVDLRRQAAAALPSVDMFRGFHRSGSLAPADRVAGKAVERLVEGPIEQGRTYSIAEL
jgi:NAD(P)-dependent dehydrogenase (short-subunit alcohol dehydrogenase family)